MSHIAQVSVNNNPNVGLFGLATEKFCILDRYAQPAFSKTVESVLGVPVVGATIGGTGLCGLFCAGNSNGVIVSSAAMEHEKDALKKAGLNFMLMDSLHNAIGNLVAANDNGCIVSPLLAGREKMISKFLSVKTVSSKMAGSDLVGSAVSVSNSGCLLHKNATEADFRLAESILKVKPFIGSVNFGSPWVKAGIIANSRGLLIGDRSSGPEVALIDEAFGFVGVPGRDYRPEIVNKRGL
jgi:translation initiation factor 6